MTNDKTVEAVARAIRHVDYRKNNFPSNRTLRQNTDDVWTTTNEYLKDRYRTLARAAIKAHTECLMEPSEEMIGAAKSAYITYALDTISEIEIRTIFQAMLSAQDKTDG